MNPEVVEKFDQKHNDLLAFEDSLFYNHESSLNFDEKEIEVLKEIHDIHIITDEEEELEVKQPMVLKSQLEEEKYTYMAYGGLISATILIAFFVLMKYKFTAKANSVEQNESRKKRN